MTGPILAELHNRTMQFGPLAVASAEPNAPGGTGNLPATTTRLPGCSSIMQESSVNVLSRRLSVNWAKSLSTLLRRCLRTGHSLGKTFRILCRRQYRGISWPG